MKTWHLIAIALGLLVIGGGVAVVRISRAGLNKIKQHEALRLQPYADQAGKMTIGWGHLIKPGEQFLLDPSGITEQHAESLLKNDLQIAESAIKNYVTVPLNTNQYDALVSFIFNVGSSAFRKSTMLKKLNAGNYQGAAFEFPRWKFTGGIESAGLLARRAVEQSLFMAV